jgi:two-component system, LytTR family, response regulator
VGKKTHLIRERMNVLEEQLDPSEFVRIHRSTIARIDRVHALQMHFNGEYVLRLKDGTALKVSRGRREAVQERLGV